MCKKKSSIEAMVHRKEGRKRKGNNEGVAANKCFEIYAEYYYIHFGKATFRLNDMRRYLCLRWSSRKRVESEVARSNPLGIVTLPVPGSLRGRVEKRGCYVLQPGQDEI